ncbi:MAG: YraN family protein [Syntrophus sp. (in: bacteria)]
MTKERISTGKMGEEIAAEHLVGVGYEILERNFRCPLGEMDIVARDHETLVFVEVRSRRTDNYGGPLESVGFAKQKKISRVAEYYLNRHGLQQVKARFDVVAVKLPPSRPEVELIRDAFDLIS